MNRKLIVALDSFKKQMKSVAFWAMVFIPILVMLVPVGINYFLAKSDQAKLGSDGNKYQIVADENISPFFKGMESEYKLVSKDTAEKSLKAEKIESYGEISEENFDVSAMESSAKEFLDKVIADYNGYFKTNFSTNGNEFQNYYKDLSLKVKDKQVDLLIVVGMFLTGFDAPTLNTN